MHPPAEALFLRYRSTGQPEPLGELFDTLQPTMAPIEVPLTRPH